METATLNAPQPVPEAPELRPGRPRPLTVLRGVAVVAAVVTLLVAVLPRVASVSWSEILTTLGAISAPDLALLALVWAGGLLIHTVTLTAALPGLTHRRALTLSLTGSAVANVLPVGGAAGVAINYHMVRSWGHDRTSFAVYTAVTNLWDVAVKMTLPLVALPVLLLAGTTLPSALLGPLLWTGALVVVVTVVVALGLVLAHHPAGERVVRRWPLALRAAQVLADSRALVRRRWSRLTFGIVGYTAALALLFYLCCRVSGVGLPLTVVAAGFVVERLLSLVNLTPGGLGAVEVVLAGVLLAAGGSALPVVTAVLLYRLFTVAIEVPVGGVGLIAYFAHRWARRGSGPRPSLGAGAA